MYRYSLCYLLNFFLSIKFHLSEFQESFSEYKAPKANLFTSEESQSIQVRRCRNIFRDVGIYQTYEPMKLAKSFAFLLVAERVTTSKRVNDYFLMEEAITMSEWRRIPACFESTQHHETSTSWSTDDYSFARGRLLNRRGKDHKRSLWCQKTYNIV